MAKKSKISDIPLLSNILGTEKIPTGGRRRLYSKYISNIYLHK